LNRNFYTLNPEALSAVHNQQAQKEAVARKQNMPTVQDPFEKVFH
jgi:hypothetical protein